MKLFFLDVRKTVQAIAVLLRATGRQRLEYLSIIKLLYIADRESWRDTGASITGDTPCAMKNGPVLSGVYDLVNLKWQREDLSVWTQYLLCEDYDLVLRGSPGDDRLSRYEIKKLTEVAKRHENDNWRQLVEVGHSLPEWQANNPANAECECGMLPIPLDDILRAVGRESDIDDIKRDAAESAAAHLLFRH